MTTIKSPLLTMVRNQMISGQTLEVEFKECLWETTQVDNLILYSFDLLWGYKTPKD